MLDSGLFASVLDAPTIAGILSDPSRIALAAQPIVDLTRTVIVGYELLARFDLARPTSPDIVFASAAACGRGAELEAVVISRALELAESRPSNCFVSINVAPKHLVSSLVTAAIGDRSLQGLVFELTEHHAFRNLPAIRGALDRLREAGAIVALDDAGSGFAGLTQILALRPEIVKLDRELVAGIHANEAKHTMVGMLGELASRLDAWLLAEGVETAEEADVLHRLGVPLSQGYFFARPEAPWTGMAREASAFLAAAKLAAPQVGEPRTTIESLVAPCPYVLRDAPWPTASVALRVDDTRRPTMMQVTHDGGTFYRGASQLMRVRRDAGLVEVVRRALARADELRWDPIVCIDERGNLDGVVMLERLIGALVDRVGTPVTDATAPRRARTPSTLS